VLVRVLIRTVLQDIVQSAVWHEIICQVRRRGLTGVCKCTYGTVTGSERETANEVCFYTTYWG
jgi:hypothetical protein